MPATERKIVVDSAVEANDEERRMLQVDQTGGIAGLCKSMQLNTIPPTEPTRLRAAAR